MENIVEWDDRYSVGISLIDKQHQGLVSMANDLYSACLDGEEAAKDYFRKTLRKVLDYVKNHFSTEEAIMQEIKYPGLEVHTKEHEDFIKTVITEVVNFEEGWKFVPETFAKFLRDWTLTHIAVSDKKYAEHIVLMKSRGIPLDTLLPKE